MEDDIEDLKNLQYVLARAQIDDTSHNRVLIQLIRYRDEGISFDDLVEETGLSKYILQSTLEDYIESNLVVKSNGLFHPSDMFDFK